MASPPPKTTDDGLKLWPVFCTADIPTDILDELITTVKNDGVGNPDGDDCLHFLCPEDAANIKSIKTAHRTLMNHPVGPFYNWLINEICEIWLTHVRPPMDVAFGEWTAFTFLVLDADSAKDRKCVVCCDAPDLGEHGDEVVLKSVRMPFAEAATSMASFEMMTMVPSEVNKDKVLNMTPPMWMDATESPPGQLAGKIATPEYARAAKRVLLKVQG